MSEHAFHFSDIAVAELSEVLGRSATELRRLLERVVNDQLNAEAWARRLSTRRRRQNVEPERKRMIRALETAARCIENASPPLHELLLPPMTLGGLMRERPREYEPLLAAAKVLRDSVRKLQIVDFGVKRRRGRPPATNRRMLAVAVAAVLSLNNVRVTTSRGGAYARVLNTVFKEAYGTAADDPFRLIKHGSHAVKGATLDELRRFARN